MEKNMYFLWNDWKEWVLDKQKETYRQYTSYSRLQYETK